MKKDTQNLCKIIDDLLENFSEVEIRKVLYEKFGKNPIDFVRRIPVEKIEPNDYNPNSVASKELELLYISIERDGYTQPVVTIYDKEKDKYVIIDGFHRYFTMKNNKDIFDKNDGFLPCVVLEKSINERMAATVRHNRARGSHSINGMSNMVFHMLDEGMSDGEICRELGMEAEELVRLKYITGFAKLFENTEYQKAWVTKQQLKMKQQYERGETPVSYQEELRLKRKNEKN